MDTKEQVKQAVEQTKRACFQLVNEGITAIGNPLNTRAGLLDTSNNMNLAIQAAFFQLEQHIDALPICGPVQFGPPGCEVMPGDNLAPIETGLHHMDRLVSMWIASPTMESDQVASIYSDLLIEADHIALDRSQARKDGEDSCQC